MPLKTGSKLCRIAPWECSGDAIAQFKISFAVIEYGVGDWVKIRSWFSPMFHSAIGHFRVPPGLCFKTRVGAQPLIWKSFFILIQIKLIFTRKVVHLASFRKWGFLELGSGLLDASPTQSLAQPQWQTGHFRGALSLCFKVRLSAKPLILKWFFYSHANKTHFHKKGFAFSLALKARVFGTRKWPIEYSNFLWPMLVTWWPSSPCALIKKTSLSESN